MTHTAGERSQERRSRAHRYNCTVSVRRGLTTPDAVDPVCLVAPYPFGCVTFAGSVGVCDRVLILFFSHSMERDEPFEGQRGYKGGDTVGQVADWVWRRFVSSDSGSQN